MRRRSVVIAVAATASLVFLPVSAASGAPGVSTSAAVSVAAPQVFKNCTELNKVYKHGVGKKGAKDKVSGTSKPVTNFKVSTAIYNANKKHDRDKDGVACEKR